MSSRFTLVLALPLAIVGVAACGNRVVQYEEPGDPAAEGSVLPADPDPSDPGDEADAGTTGKDSGKADSGKTPPKDGGSVPPPPPPPPSPWTSLSTVGAPSGRSLHSAVWTGTEMIVWGGFDGANNKSDGAAYAPATNTWRTIATAGAPIGRSNHTAVWTGSSMIVWGGYDGASQLGSGGRYTP